MAINLQDGLSGMNAVLNAKNAQNQATFAGSGKTEVLTERIYYFAKRDKSLDRFLVLTFTDLAAGEMKARVRKKLLNDPETKELRCITRSIPRNVQFKIMRRDNQVCQICGKNVFDDDIQLFNKEDFINSLLGN